MRRSDAFPSNRLKAEDLQGKRVKLKMAKCLPVEVNDRKTGGTKRMPELHFYGTEKTLLLNVTNWTEIEEAYGEESDDWDGQIIELYTARVQFGTDRVDAIRVNAMPAKPTAAQAEAAQRPIDSPRKAAPPSSVNGDAFPGDAVTPTPPASKFEKPFLDDEIPF
jgi:hypothetical protein